MTRRIDIETSASHFEDIADHMWSMVRGMNKRNFFRSHSPHCWSPRVNLYETAQRYLICVELAGMKGDEIDIRADGGELHIRGTRKKPHLPGGDKEESVSVHLMEIDSGRFHRKVPIPDGVDIEQITATYKDGYLWIALPRK